jgi:hypothetical protein
LQQALPNGVAGTSKTEIFGGAVYFLLIILESFSHIEFTVLVVLPRSHARKADMCVYRAVGGMIFEKILDLTMQEFSEINVQYGELYKYFN